MQTIQVQLEQHTPLIHFQGTQFGATLRASDVKPRLDRYILSKLKKSEYGDEKWYKKGDADRQWLDYQMKIYADGKPIEFNHKDNELPCYFGNRGKNYNPDLKGILHEKNLRMTIYTKHGDLVKRLQDNIEIFFLLHNFGQRSSKGYGCFTVSSLTINGANFTVNTPKPQLDVYSSMRSLAYEWTCQDEDRKERTIRTFKSIEKLYNNWRRGKDAMILEFKKDPIQNLNWIKDGNYKQHLGLNIKGLRDFERYPSPLLFKIFYSSNIISCKIIYAQRAKKIGGKQYYKGKHKYENLGDFSAEKFINFLKK